MVRVLQSAGAMTHAHWNLRERVTFNIVRYRRVVEAIIESAAVYSFASGCLAVTILSSPDVGYTILSSMFSPIIVRSQFSDCG